MTTQPSPMVRAIRSARSIGAAREHLEHILWELTEFCGSATVIDDLLDTIDAYADRRIEAIAQPLAAVAPVPAPVQDVPAPVLPELPRTPVPLGAVARPGYLICMDCRYELLPSAFHKDRSLKSGYKSRCGSCVKRRKHGLPPLYHAYLEQEVTA